MTHPPKLIPILPKAPEGDVIHVSEVKVEDGVYSMDKVYGVLYYCVDKNKKIISFSAKTCSSSPYWDTLEQLMTDECTEPADFYHIPTGRRITTDPVVKDWVTPDEIGDKAPILMKTSDGYRMTTKSNTIEFMPQFSYYLIQQ